MEEGFLGYHKLPSGVLCRCIHLVRRRDGDAWCCGGRLGVLAATQKAATDSYPFLAIAKQHHVGYAVVLAIADCFDQEGGRALPPVPLQRRLLEDVEAAVVRERNRRAVVQREMGAC